MAGNMLTAYYGKNCDSRDLFKNLRIVQDPSFEKHLNKHNVFFLNIQKFWSETHDIRKMIELLQKSLLWELQQQYPEVQYFDKADLTRSLSDIFAQTGEGFIFIVDEWDCLFREVKESPEIWKIYLEFLQNLLKDAEYAELVYMTGILPVKRKVSQSALNMFTEYSMTNPMNLAEFVGFTESEVEGLCKKYDIDFEETKKWYNGYYLPKIGNVYNPKSVVTAMLSGIFDNYWTKTASYEAIEIYIKMNFDGLKESVVRLLGGDRIKINPDRFLNDMATVGSIDEVFTLFVHLGYLGYDRDNQEVFIPNSEIASEFVNAIEGENWKSVVDALKASDQLLQDILQKNATAVAEAIDTAHIENASILKYNDENSLACVISLSLYSARKYYTVIRELPAGKGFADLVFLPHPNQTDKPAMVVELKWDKNANSAIRQIKEKKYTAGCGGVFAGCVGAGFNKYICPIKKKTEIICIYDGRKPAPTGNLLLVGINYDKETKKHECVIEEALL
ncbi:ATPase AAA [Fibrobacterales bacterium]|nr:ATPase AAA [Fibrobacterales bacterium]